MKVRIKLISFFLFLLASPIFPEQIPSKSTLNPKIFFLNSGYETLSLANSTYFPERDILVFKDGRKVKNYFKGRLGIKFFKSINEKFFSEPPFGWCSFYYYGSEITPTEILENAKFLSKYFKKYGLKYIQIDVGWQGNGSNRDWFKLSDYFGKFGMKKIAGKIKNFGFIPGLWISPFGCDEKNFQGFLPLNSNNWLGKFLYFPEKKNFKYIDYLFKRIRNWGYGYIKIDGLPIAIKEYKKRGEIDKFREILKRIKDVCGDKTFLLGCWGIPLKGVGILNGARIGKDVRCNWDGFKIAYFSTLKWYFLHNIAWYDDPDVLMVRKPIPFETAKAWATLLGITGQVLMFSDNMVDLSGKRLDLLKKISPPQKIYPVYLFPIEKTKPFLWDLKVKNGHLKYDVVAYFNFKNKLDGKFLNFRDIGLNPEKDYHLFDFWNEEYLGIVKGGVYIDSLPRGVKVLVITPVKESPSLIGTNRHIVETKCDILKINEGKYSVKGKARFVENEKDSFFFGYPSGKNYRIKKVLFKGKYKIFNHSNWSEVVFYCGKGGIKNFEVRFSSSSVVEKGKKRNLFPPLNLKKIKIGNHKYLLKWDNPYYPVSGYVIFIDGKLYGYTFKNEIKIKMDDSGEHLITIRGLWYGGIMSKKGIKIYLGGRK